MAQDINHKAELQHLKSDLLEIIAHHCKGEMIVARGHAYNYHRERRDAALMLINERIKKDNKQL